MTGSGTAIWGVGTSAFGKQTSLGGPRLAWQATVEALDDAGLNASDIEAVYAGTVFGDPGTVTRSLQQIGIVEVPVITIENACASGTSAFHEANQAVQSGRYERVLAFGIETMTAHFDGAISPIASDPDGAQGYAMPSIYGMSATRYQYEFGVTSEQMAAVAVKNRGHALGNPRAQHRKTVTLEQVLGSRMVADPITLFQCCSIADAAAAAVIGPLGGSRDPQQEVAIRSSALRSGPTLGPHHRQGVGLGHRGRYRSAGLRSRGGERGRHRRVRGPRRLHYR